MTATKIRRCRCGHPKSIHLRIYGPSYRNRTLPQPCNHPACRCKQYKPSGK
jgi:hypothetical protein